jgi:hypothetical protein
VAHDHDVLASGTDATQTSESTIPSTPATADSINRMSCLADSFGAWTTTLLARAQVPRFDLDVHNRSINPGAE